MCVCVCVCVCVWVCVMALYQLKSWQWNKTFIIYRAFGIYLINRLTNKSISSGKYQQFEKNCRNKYLLRCYLKASLKIFIRNIVNINIKIKDQWINYFSSLLFYNNFIVFFYSVNLPPKWILQNTKQTFLINFIFGSRLYWWNPGFGNFIFGKTKQIVIPAYLRNPWIFIMNNF